MKILLLSTTDDAEPVFSEDGDQMDWVTPGATLLSKLGSNYGVFMDTMSKMLWLVNSLMDELDIVKDGEVV